jgi:hypothetical protein
MSSWYGAGGYETEREREREREALREGESKKNFQQTLNYATS